MTFYAGRVANLVLWSAVIAMAIRLAPQCAARFAFVALASVVVPRRPAAMVWLVIASICNAVSIATLIVGYA